MAMGGLPNLFMIEAYSTATVRSGECVKKKGQLIDEMRKKMFVREYYIC
jgi:hypothetical protein